MVEKSRDRDLISAILRGDEAASGALFRRYVDGVYGYLLPRTGGSPQDAEDLCQETFVAAWTDLARFDPQGDFWAWLLGIARRRLSKSVRRSIVKRRTERSLEGAGSQLEAPGPLLAERLVGKEASERVAACLSALPPRARTLLRRKYVDGKSVKEIALELDLTSEAVDSALQRARETLRDLLGRGEREDEHEPAFG